MIEVLILLILLFIAGPFLAVMLFAAWSLHANELNRYPTKEEWKAGKRRRIDD